MAKRKLSRRQIWQVNKIQQERLKRAQRQREAALSGLASDELGPEQNGVIISHYGAALDVEDSHGEVFRCAARQNIGDLVCGDEVVWQMGRGKSGVVCALKPRHSLLSRPDLHNQFKPVAANIDQILIVSAVTPELNKDLIDRYLVAAENIHIQPVIIINKVDLLNNQELHQLQQHVAIYSEIGYRILYTSVPKEHGLGDLIDLLKDRTSVFVGQSGVGKSSLIKRLLPDTEIRIGELSRASGKGRHTTSVTRLYHFLDGGNLIDSPGVRDFGLTNITPAGVVYSFVEFRPLLGLCRFNDCKHDVEPDCAITKAVREGKISQHRLDSLHRIIKSLQEG